MQQSQRNEFHEREALRDAVAQWAFPTDKAEIEVAQAIAQLPVFEIRTSSRLQLSKVGMEMGQCHENCRTFAAHDDSWTPVTGWVPGGDVFILYSVIAKVEGVLCVTPDVYNRPTVDFIPDTEIEWGEEGNRYIAFRKGLRRANAHLEIIDTTVHVDETIVTRSVIPRYRRDLIVEDAEVILHGKAAGGNPTQSDKSRPFKIWA